MQSTELPPRFVLEVPDSSLAPNLPRGTSVVFECADRAEPGDCVLVKAASGTRYIRRYAQGRDGQWLAQAIDPAFVTLQSGAHGLVVEAVMAWRAERRV